MLAIEVQENLIKLVSFRNGKVYFYPHRITFPTLFPKTADKILAEATSEAFHSWSFSDLKDPILITDLSFQTSFPYVAKTNYREVIGKVNLPILTVRDLRISEEEILPYLPFLESTGEEVENFFENRKLFGNLTPATPYELAVWQAYTKTALAKLKGKEDWDHQKAYFIDDLFWNLPYPSQVAATILDGLTPLGLLEIYYDDKGYFVPWLSLYAKGMLDHKVFEEHLPFSLLSSSLSFSDADTLSIESEHGGHSEVRYEAGDLFVIPVEENEKIKVEKSKSSWELRGGKLGVIVDARGRPLKLPSQTPESKKIWRRWEQALAAHGEVEKI